MRRIAPTLHGHMAEVKMSADRACEYCPEWAELRALLGVARAAQKVLDDHASCIGPGCAEHATLARPLARLDRVSGGGK